MQSKSDTGLINKTKVLSTGAVSLVRASKRNTSTSEQDSLEKATQLKACKNLDTASLKGKETQLCSFDTLDDSILLAATSSLGISFGINEHEISNSLKALKDLESVRLAENFNLEVQKNLGLMMLPLFAP
jgi:hypothetical protein